MAITAAMVKELRESTGAGMMDVKKALADAGNDEDKAVALLRERGIVKAAKKADRVAAEGLIGVQVTDGRGVDHVIEVGGPATLAQSMVAARIGGHISVIGILTGIAGELQLVPALVRQLRLQGVLVGSRTQQQEMIRAIDANGIRPVIDKRFALDEIVEAFRYQESNQHFGKICLEF